MARRRPDSMPPPPGREGGYEFEVVELGPPTYFTPPPVAAARGPLIPMGDGESRAARPAPPLGYQLTGLTKRVRSIKGRSRPADTTPTEQTQFVSDAALDFEASFQLGLTRHALLDHTSAIALLERSVEVARRIGDPRMTATALHSLGVVLREIGRPTDALTLTTQAVSLAEASADRRMLARVLVSHGSLLRQLGHFEEAAAVLARAVATIGDF